MYHITITTAFAASHAIRLPDGTDEPLHGHNWDVSVTVAADPLDEIETVMDFHDLERIVAGIIGPFDNGHLNDVPPFKGGSVNCSAERVAWWIGTQVAAALPSHVSLIEASVGEAPRCTARYLPDAQDGEGQGRE